MKESAGLILYRSDGGQTVVLLGHNGGPFWVNKPKGWTFPKGVREDHETDLVAVAEREFTEELGSPPPPGPSVPLGSVRSSGKVITLFARPGTFDAETITSNRFTMEWPPRSGVQREFPELDRAGWFTLDEARQQIAASQVPFVDRLETYLGGSGV